MTAETTELPSVPQMAAEAGYELDESHVPFRISGYLALILGLLSIFSLVGAPALVFPLAGVAFGFFALRPSDGPRPAGTKPAMLGLILAVGFGSCGLMLPMLKTWTLGSQAEYFARQYLDVLCRGEFELAMEMRKDYINRLPTEMPLNEHYSASAQARKSLSEFKQQNGSFAEMGPGQEWTLTRPVRVFHQFGFDKADVYIENRSGSSKLHLILKYQIDHRDGKGQWMIEKCGAQMERLVAESVL